MNGPHCLGRRDRRGRRQQRWPVRILGLDIGPSEAETFWTAFLRKLARRRLRGVKLVISDAHDERHCSGNATYLLR